MSKVLCLPDIHGRDFWKEPCNNWDGEIVFLGDYHDPYPEQVFPDESLENLKELIEWSKTHKATFLLGNHDVQYYTGQGYSRYDKNHSKEILQLIQELHPQWIHVIDNVLFSHSGVEADWLDKYNLNLEDLNPLNAFDDRLYDISYYRGGDTFVPSFIWGDVRNFMGNLGQYQVFGHTQMIGPVITKEWACIDCKQAFIIDTELYNIITYESYKENSQKLS